MMIPLISCFAAPRPPPKGSTTKIYVRDQGRHGGLGVAYNGKSLTPEQRRDEEARVKRFLNDPEELKKKRSRTREHRSAPLRIVRATARCFFL